MNPYKIILVEDEILAAQSIKKLLKDIELTDINIYSSGEEALKKIPQQQPDLIIMDIQLSGSLSGIDVVSELNKKNPFPVIFITAYTDNKTINKIIELKSYGFIPKPVDHTTFYFVIKTVLDRIQTDKLLTIKSNEIIEHKEQLEDIIEERTNSLISINQSLEKEILRRKEVEQELLYKTETMKDELDAAQQVQRSFLPEIPQCDFATISYRYTPAQALGGDYLSITPLQEGGIGIFVGDVSGHGVSAALITAMVKSISNRICRINGSHPAKYMNNLNQELISELNDETFLTAFYCVLNLKADENVSCRCSRGGHPAPILWRKNSKKIELIETWGLLLGCFEESEYKEEEIDLFSGDRLFIFTDGVNESQNKKREMFNHEGMIEILEPLCEENQSIDCVLDKIIEGAQNLRNDGPFQDDMLIIGIEIN